MQPFVVRIVAGDITQVPTSMAVVNHFNGLAPSGAEGAVDDFLAGALGRLSARGALDGHFGSFRFFPASTSPLAAASVLVLGLGDMETFNSRRLPELGAALVEAAVAFRIHDAATVVHGGGIEQVGREAAARRLVRGVLEALGTVRGDFRELTIVERDARGLPAIRLGVKAVRRVAGVEMYVDEATSVRASSSHPVAPVGRFSQTLPKGARQRPRSGRPPRRVPEATPEVGSVPPHVRVGLNRAGPQLKITVLDERSPWTVSVDYPDEVTRRIWSEIAGQTLHAKSLIKRRQGLRGVGEQIFNAFLGRAEGGGLRDLLRRSHNGFLVLSLDQVTVDVPWEIAFDGRGYLSRGFAMSRQLELNGPGRTATFARPFSGRVLVIGNPTGDLPGAEAEALAVARALGRIRGVTVESLIGSVTFEEVSRSLNEHAYDILHYAGHARFDPLRPEVGGLELADATLTAEDLSTRRYLPRLFFANGCHSAQTDTGVPSDAFEGAEPTRSLVAGLLQAGVWAFIGGMWQVDDQAGRTFAEAFYAALAGRSRSRRFTTPVGRAVVEARASLVSRFGEGEPTWAGYALYGNPWTVLGPTPPG